MEHRDRYYTNIYLNAVHNAVRTVRSGQDLVDSFLMLMDPIAENIGAFDSRPHFQGVKLELYVDRKGIAQSTSDIDIEFHKGAFDMRTAEGELVATQSAMSLRISFGDDLKQHLIEAWERSGAQELGKTGRLAVAVIMSFAPFSDRLQDDLKGTLDAPSPEEHSDEEEAIPTI